MLNDKVGNMSIERWLSALKPTTARTSISNLNRFLAWLKVNGGKFSTMAPDDLIAYQKQAVGDSRYDILDLAETYIRTREGTFNYLTVQAKDIRSFFIHNRAELPRDPSFRVNGTTAPVQGGLSPDEIRKVILSCNPMYQAVFLCMFQGGMGEQEFFDWNTNGLSKLVADLESEPTTIRVDMLGRKSMRNRKPYYTLISGDALKTLKVWMELRPEVLRRTHIKRELNKVADGNKSIFVDQYGNGVTKMGVYQQWHSKTIKVGIIPKGRGNTNSTRYGKNLHELRDSFRTLAQKSPCDKTIPEFLMGHVIDPLGYNKAHQDVGWVQKEYKLALPWLNIMSSNRPYGLVSEDIIDEQQTQIKNQQKELNDQYQQIQELKEKMEYTTITPETEAMIKMLAEMYANGKLTPKENQTQSGE